MPAPSLLAPCFLGVGFTGGREACPFALLGKGAGAGVGRSAADASSRESPSVPVRANGDELLRRVSCDEMPAARCAFRWLLVVAHPRSCFESASCWRRAPSTICSTESMGAPRGMEAASTAALVAEGLRPSAPCCRFERCFRSGTGCCSAVHTSRADSETYSTFPPRCRYCNSESEIRTFEPLRALQDAICSLTAFTCAGVSAAGGSALELKLAFDVSNAATWPRSCKWAFSPSGGSGASAAIAA